MLETAFADFMTGMSDVLVRRHNLVAERAGEDDTNVLCSNTFTWCGYGGRIRPVFRPLTLAGLPCEPLTGWELRG